MIDRELKIWFALMGLVTFLIFYGASITGLVVQTSYCDEVGCYALCNSKVDCYGNEVCCEHLGKGICVEDSYCEEEFVLMPEISSEMLNKVVEQPVQIRDSRPLFYLTLFVIIFVFGLVHLLLKQYMHHKK